MKKASVTFVGALLLLMLSACGPSAKQIEESRAAAVKEFASAQGSVRVSFAKNGVAPERLSGSMDEKGCDYDVAKWSSLKFKVMDKVWSKSAPGSERAALACEPTVEGMGWGAFYFNFAGGDGEMKWYDTKQALDDDLAARMK